MDFSKIMDFLENFDPAEFIPELETVLGKLELVMRVVVLAGPAVLLALGILYMLLPAREANHHWGYRFYWGMSSVEVWRFTQLIGGAAWALLGLVLGIIMYLNSKNFAGMEAMDMVWKGVKYILWEMGALAVVSLLVDITVIVFYNSKGDRRKFGKKKKK